MEKKASVAMTLVIASMWVTGCSSAEGEQTAAGAETPGAVSAGEEAPQAFVFESGTLEIGDFDPEALGDDLFDPCTEISAAEFAAAGFENVEPMPEEYTGLAHGMSVCHSWDLANGHSFTFMNTEANRATLESTPGGLLPESSSGILPSMYTYSSSTTGEHGCAVQVDTERGGFVVIATQAGQTFATPNSCSAAAAAMENIYMSTSVNNL